mmetsp:Transcript_40613/g.130686  ORF Transcript_40613/g.130686 Transcript_40613/m.130686 type:complete len:344 (-) Transcript_40613:675-1706(-)
MLPGVAQDVVHAAGAAEGVHGAGGGPVCQVHIARSVLAPRRPVRGVLQVRGDGVAQPEVLVLHGQAQGLARLLRQVLAEGSRLVVAALDGPIPRHRHLFAQRPQVVLATRPDAPEARCGWSHVGHPAPTFLGPEALRLVAVRLQKVHELLVADQELGGGKRRDVHVGLFPELVVPTVGLRPLPRAAQPCGAMLDGDQAVWRQTPGGARIRALVEAPAVANGEGTDGLHDADVGLAMDDARGLQVDVVVLDAHHYDPPKGVLLDGPLHGLCPDHPVHQEPDVAAEVQDCLQEFRSPGFISPGLRPGLPDVGVGVPVVPTHLVHSDGHLHLQDGIDARGDVLAQV